MSDEKAKHHEVQVYSPVPLGNMDLKAMATTFAMSGMFKDAGDASKAVVKILAGAELGLPPVTAMTNIHVFEGKVILGAAAMAALVQRSGRWNYEVTEHSDEACEIAFFDGGREVGRSRFSMDDARKANLASKPIWKNYPRNLLYARAMSNGVKWYCPGVFGGPVYTPEELREPDFEVVEEPPEESRSTWTLMSKRPIQDAPGSTVAPLPTVDATQEEIVSPVESSEAPDPPFQTPGPSNDPILDKILDQWKLLAKSAGLDEADIAAATLDQYIMSTNLFVASDLYHLSQSDRTRLLNGLLYIGDIHRDVSAFLTKLASDDPLGGEGTPPIDVDPMPSQEMLAILPVDTQAGEEARKAKYAALSSAWRKIEKGAGIESATERMSRVAILSAIASPRGVNKPVESRKELSDNELWRITQSFANQREAWVQWLRTWALTHTTRDADGKLNLKDDEAT